jgi:23S rRNA (pseudouridine1915-N3)-methyltransferase
MPLRFLPGWLPFFLKMSGDCTLMLLQVPDDVIDGLEMEVGRIKSLLLGHTSQRARKYFFDKPDHSGEIPFGKLVDPVLRANPVGGHATALRDELQCFSNVLAVKFGRSVVAVVEIVEGHRSALRPDIHAGTCRRSSRREGERRLRRDSLLPVEAAEDDEQHQRNSREKDPFHVLDSAGGTIRRHAAAGNVLAMKLRVAWIGKTKEAAIQSLGTEYLKRLGRYISVEAHELASEDSVLKLASKAGRTAPVLILLDSRGKQLSSEELASLLREYQERGAQELIFAIGPADGWSDDARKRAAKLLSLGKMTLPHELARIVLLEQLYRGFTILAGHPYHSGH